MHGAFYRSAIVGSVLGAWMLAAPSASAEQVRLMAELSGANVTPPVLPTASTATGTFEGTLDTETRELTYTLTFEPLLGNFAGAHFHAPPTPNHPNPNAASVPVLPIRGRASPIEGTATLTPGQMEQLLAGEWLVNVKSSTFPGGQMQGPIVRVE